MKICTNVLDAIGNTPLIQLSNLTKNLHATILVKYEAMNPGGSVKDRIGWRMIAWAEERGLLKPGGVIIEPTSGNTGVGLAMAAALKGYRCIFVLPDKINEDKRSLLRAFGAEIVITPTSATPDDPQHYVNVAKRLAGEIPGAYWPNQYNHPANKQAHIETTGPEIWRDTEGKIDVLVGGMGTCGTMSGTATFLKQQNPNLHVVAVDPEGSIFSGDMPHSYLVEGIGEDFLPRNLERGLIDEFIRVSDKESFHTARRLAREEGIMAGGSAGSALAGALRYAMRLTNHQTIVVILPDGGRGYLSTLYNDQWMQQKGMLDFEPRTVTLEEVLAQRTLSRDALLSVTPTDEIATAIELMQTHHISQLPVLDGERCVGSVQEDALMKSLFDGLDVAHQTVGSLMGAPLPTLEITTNATEAYRLLMAGVSGIVIARNHTPVAVLTRIDLVSFWSKERASGS